VGVVTVTWFWQIIDNISENWRQRQSCNGRLIGNHVWPFKKHDCPWPWVRLKVTILLFKTSAIHITQKTLRVLTTMCLHRNWKVQAACDLNIFSASLAIRIASEALMLRYMRLDYCLGRSVCLSVWKVYCSKTADWIQTSFRVVSGVRRWMSV